MKCDLILNETLQGGVQPDYAAQWAQYYRSQVVLFDDLGHILYRVFFLLVRPQKDLVPDP